MPVVIDSRSEEHDNGTTDNVHSPRWEDELMRATSYMELSSTSKHIFLQDAGNLFGVRIDDNSAPRRSHLPVATIKPGRQLNLREMNEIDTEVITTKDERQTNYVHQGWSLSALSAASSWTLSRIARNNQENRTAASLTKRVIIQRLQIEFSLDDISPVPGFEEEVRTALGKDGRPEKFHALYQALERWGDVIPLMYDIGTSLTTTDLESNVQRCLEEISYLGLSNLNAHKTAKVCTRGGQASVLQGGVGKWLYNTVPVGQWAQVRIVKAGSVTALLSDELQAQLLQLSSSLITYNPPTLAGSTAGGHSFDGSRHALKTISSVTVVRDTHVNSLGVAYSDGTSFNVHGGTGGSSDMFCMDNGEYISELVTWTDLRGVCALQFITNTGRMSQCYGGDNGTPTVISETGGLLVAFAGKAKENIIYQLQGIWRHDIKHTRVGGERKYSQYYGGTGGSPFYDRPPLGFSDSTYISSIRVRCGAFVDGIQFTYANQEGDRMVKSEGPYHGGGGGVTKSLDLDPGEHIVMVRGRHDPCLYQVCFVTSLGRTSETFGFDARDYKEFVCSAPLATDGRAMRLHSIYGKSGSWLNGIVFVWAPV